MFKIAVALCAVISIARTSSLEPSHIDSDDHDVNTKFRDYEFSTEPKFAVKTWYQDEAFLRVINGTFTIELLTEGSRPKSLYAEDFGIVVVERGFAKIPSLESISLEDNLIERIDSLVFAGLPELVYLNLARNRISRLFEDSFRGLNKLQVLKLNHNSLRSPITFSTSINVLPALTHLYLQHNLLTSIVEETPQDPQLVCNSNLRYLYLSNNLLDSFHLYSNYEPTCPIHLTHLFLDDNRLTTFRINEEIPLEALSLDGNDLTEISEINPGLKFFSLARNSIREINGTENVGNIVRFILSHNKLNQEWVDSVSFQDLSSLVHLALDHNDIPVIPDGFFYNLSSLSSLYLANNQIEYISPNAFALLPALRELSFDTNSLASFPGKESFGESNLTYLDLSNNKVENILGLEVTMIPKLKVLKLAGNPLKRIEPGSVPRNVTILL